MPARTNTAIEPRMLTALQGSAYTGRGLTNFKKWAEEIGAKRKFGKLARYDRAVIDAYFDKMAEEVKQ